MKHEKPTSWNSRLTNRDPEEFDRYLGETFSKRTLEEVIMVECSPKVGPDAMRD